MLLHIFKTTFLVYRLVYMFTGYFLFCILNNTIYISPMEPELITMTAESGLKKNFIAKKLGIVPNHFYQCLSGNRRMSAKKQAALRKLLIAVN